MKDFDKTRNALISFYDECISENASKEITIQTVWFVFKQLILYYIENTDDFDSYSLSVGYYRIYDSYDDVSDKTIIQRWEDLVRYRFWEPCDYLDFYDKDRYSFCEWYKSLKEDIEQSKGDYFINKYAIKLSDGITDFVSGLDESILRQINYFLSLNGNKRQNGIYRQFQVTCQLYLVTEYKKYKQNGSTS